MIDGCGREIDHLRLSLTDHCNLACRYCIPDRRPPRGRTIDRRFALEIVRWLSERHGIRHVRLTGGEPLLYPELASLIERLSTIAALHEVTLTTNAQALARQAITLRSAGLSRLNVSLDTLDPARFAYITRGGDLTRTLDGIQAAVAADLTPVKINVIAQRGLNEDELPGIAVWGLARGCIVRFLEVMPIGPLAHVAARHLIPATEILERLARRIDLRPIPRSRGQPAQEFAAAAEGLRGVVGVIAPMTRPFCSRCRRLRVTAQGWLVACLHDDRHFDLRPHWNGRALDVDGADALLRTAVEGKPAVGSPAQSLSMLSLGG